MIFKARCNTLSLLTISVRWPASRKPFPCKPGNLEVGGCRPKIKSEAAQIGAGQDRIARELYPWKELRANQHYHHITSDILMVKNPLVCVQTDQSQNLHVQATKMFIIFQATLRVCKLCQCWGNLDVFTNGLHYPGRKMISVTHGWP